MSKVLGSGHVCSECGELRMNVSSGSVCPNGHGRINPRVPASARREYERQRLLEKLHEAEQVPGRPRTFILRGDVYIRSSMRLAETMAKFRGKPIYLKPASSRRDDAIFKKADSVSDPEVSEAGAEVEGDG